MEEIQSYQHPPPASQPSECVDHPPEDGTIHTPPDAIQKDPPLVDSATDSMDPRERPDRTPNVPHGSSLPCDSTDTTFNYNPNNQPLDTVCDSDEDLIEQCALLIDEAMADELLSNALSHMAPEEGSDDEGMDEENVRAWSKYRHLRSSLSLAARDTTRLDTESVADILADTHGASDIRMGRPEQTDGDDIRQNTRQLTTDDIEELRAMVGNAWAMTEDERAASKHWRRATNADFSGKSRAQTPREIKRRRKRHRSPRPLDSPLRLSSSPSDPDDSPLSSSSSSSDEDGTTVDHKNPRGNCTKSDLATIAYHDIRIRSKIPREGDNIYMRLFQRIMGKRRTKIKELQTRLAMQKGLELGIDENDLQEVLRVFGKDEELWVAEARKAKRKIADITGMKVIQIDRCRNNCMAFQMDEEVAT
ncbi:hypothetical protein BJ508DRAFT_336902 [Ascobolus immersus RN42]|uniref:Uncharacterized protein n=1 Tax=Ascobolus immersus RN42 TaxID=1160509 RepID=A0A3N4HB61_ASCIM|nr:hypothetical protein BJ508DRAFT_336902 [Ascobolus immersus RN42]